MRDILRSLSYMKRHMRLTILAFVSMTSATLFSLIIPQVLREVVDRGLPVPLSVAMFTPRFANEGLLMTFPQPNLIFEAAGLLFVLSLFRALVAFGQRFFGERLSQYVSYDLRNDFYDKVQRLPLAYHDHS